MPGIPYTVNATDSIRVVIVIWRWTKEANKNLKSNLMRLNQVIVILLLLCSCYSSASQAFRMPMDEWWWMCHELIRSSFEWWCMVYDWKYQNVFESYKFLNFKLRLSSSFSLFFFFLGLFSAIVVSRQQPNDSIDWNAGICNRITQMWNGTFA